MNLFLHYPYERIIIIPTWQMGKLKLIEINIEININVLGSFWET